MASMRDWELGFRILERAIESGAEVWDDEGGKVNAEDLSKEAAGDAFKEYWAFDKNVLVPLANDGMKPTLRCGLFSLVLTDEELKLDDTKLVYNVTPFCL